MISDQTERKAQIVNFDKSLRGLIADAPDAATKRELNRALMFYRKQYFVPFEQKKVEILKLIKNGAATFTDLVMESGYNKRFVAKILKVLREENAIRREKVKSSGSVGGRPRICYFAVI